MTLVTIIAASVVLAGCAGGGSAATAGMQGKVQDRMQEKATDKNAW